MDGRARWIAETVLPQEAALRIWLRRRCNVHGADLDDVVQDVFIRLLQTQSIAHIQCLRSYIRQTAWSVLGSRLRRQKCARFEPIDPDELQRHSCDAPLQDRIAQDRDALQRLDHALASMPPRTRKMIWLYKVENIHAHDVAQRLSISVSTVHKDSHAALAQLRAACQR